MDKSALFSFTPSLMYGETLEAIFVQREALAADLVERIRESILTQNKLHTLIIGARGMGKTHLVSLVHHRVQAMDDLKERLLIAWLREEEWGVTSFLDLLLRIFRALAESDPTVEGRMEELYDLSSEEAEAAGIKLLNELIGERTLLLIAENLDDLFNGLGEQGQQKLRAFLQTHANCTILATSPRLFNGVQRRTAPFYGFFRPVHLYELTTAEAQQLLVNIAKWRHQTDLVNFLNTPTGQTRVKAVQHLAGGNPRIYIIFADFLTHQSIEELVSPFMSLVDALTPYYQSRMQYLSAQQRKIVELLCEKKSPITVKTIAQRCFMTAQTASSQLKELREKGYVRAEAIGRDAFYEITEPLMRICLGVKKERGEPLRLMVDFLRVWYPKNELQTMQQALLREDGRSAVMCRYLEQALDSSEIVDEDPRIQAYLDEIQANFNQEDYEHALKIAKKLLQIKDSWFERERYAACLWYLGRYEEALASFDQSIQLNSNYPKSWYNRGCSLLALGHYEEAITSFNKAIKIKSDYLNAWLNRGVALSNLDRHEEAIVSYDKALQIAPDKYEILHHRGLALSELGRYEEAISSYEKSLQIKPESPEDWNNRGVGLIKLWRYEEAISSFDTALQIKSEFYQAWYNRGIVLGYLGHHEEEIASYDKALQYNADNPDVWHNRGVALLKLGRYEEAISSNDKAIKIKQSDESTWNNRGYALSSLGRHKEAIISYDKALKIKPDYWQAWGMRGDNLSELGHHGKAITSYNKAIEINPAQLELWRKRGLALLSLGRHKEAVISFDKALEITPESEELKELRLIVLVALGYWDENHKTLEILINEEKFVSSQFIKIFLEIVIQSLFTTIPDPKQWQLEIVQLVNRLEGRSLLPELGVALVKAASELTSDLVSQAKATAWRDAWAEVVGHKPEFELPLRLLNTALHYKQTPEDPRVFLELPTEERKILQQALGLEQSLG
jgi:tetratricopeptide (TPR) repeat protein